MSTQTPAPPPEREPSASGGHRDAVVQQAVDDLVRRLDVPAADIELVAVEEVTWRDGSLGCAQPDMSYTQALVEGSRITLRAGDRTYEYHSGGSGVPSLCEDPTQ